MWYLRRTRHGGKSPLKVKTWIAGAFIPELFFFPALYFIVLASMLLYFIYGGSHSTLAPRVAAACLINVMTGSVYAVAHRCHISLSLLSQFFDF